MANERLQAQTEALAGVDGQMSVAEALLHTVYLYLETPEDMEAISEALEKVDKDALSDEGTPETVRALYDKLLAQVGPDIAQAYYQTGYAAFLAEDYETAIEDLSKAVEYDPANEEALFALGNSYRERGNNSQAIETYEELLRLFPDTQKASQSQNYLDDLRG